MPSYRLWPATNGPSSPASYTGNFISGTVFTVTASNLWFAGYWWWHAGGAQPTGPTKCALWSVWNPTGTTIVGMVIPGSVVTSGTLSPGWNYIPLSTPVQLSIFDELIAAVGVNGAFPDTSNYWGPSQPGATGIVNGPLMAWGNPTTGSWNTGGFGSTLGLQQGCFTTGGSDPSVTMPLSGSSTDNFWVDVQITDATPVGYTGSYRLWPNRIGADSVTAGDDNLPYIVANEIQIGASCVLDKLWYFSYPGATTLCTNADIWTVDPGGTTGTLVVTSSSPTWHKPDGSSGVAGSGWLYTIMSPTTLPIGTYKVSVYDSAGVTGTSSKRLGYWGLMAGENAHGVVAPNGITEGPMYAPDPSHAHNAFSYNPTSGTPTEPGQSTFAIGPPDKYPNLYVGVHSTAGDLFQNYWVDMEVTGAALNYGNLAMFANTTLVVSASGGAVSGAVAMQATAGLAVTGHVPPVIQELLSEYYQWTVATGATGAPAAGSIETVTVVSATGAPPAVAGVSQFRIVDAADTHAPPEIMLVTNVSGSTWTIKRGAETGAPWAHAPTWVAIPVLTAAGLKAYIQGLP